MNRSDMPHSLHLQRNEVRNHHEAIPEDTTRKKKMEFRTDKRSKGGKMESLPGTTKDVSNSLKGVEARDQENEDTQSYPPERC